MPGFPAAANAAAGKVHAPGTGVPVKLTPRKTPARRPCAESPPAYAGWKAPMESSVMSLLLQAWLGLATNREAVSSGG